MPAPDTEPNTRPSFQHRYDGLPKLDEATLYWRRETLFLVLAGMFLGTLAMLNILGITRFLNLAWFIEGSDQWRYKIAIAVGVLPYPLTFLMTDFISELYGRKRASVVVWVGLLLNIWVVSILWLGGVMPGFEPADQQGTGVFFDVRRLAFGAVSASMVAYLVAQFVDVYVFHFWKRVTNNRHLWLRNNGSTLVSQLVDTVAVILVTHFYAHALPVVDGEPIWPQLAAFIATGYAFKAAAALVDTIPFYVGAFAVARYLRLPPPDHAPHPPAAAAVEAGVG
ncbi:MAG: queuosine precursor transporter [Phycisphaerales bacterium]|nr:queuosine precursor transporter [Phycisphaerales bacterium]